MNILELQSLDSPLQSSEVPGKIIREHLALRSSPVELLFLLFLFLFFSSQHSVCAEYKGCNRALTLHQHDWFTRHSTVSLELTPPRSCRSHVTHLVLLSAKSTSRFHLKSTKTEIQDGAKTPPRSGGYVKCVTQRDLGAGYIK